MRDIIACIIVQFVFAVTAYLALVAGQTFSGSWGLMISVTAGLCAICIGVSERANEIRSTRLSNRAWPINNNFGFVNASALLVAFVFIAFALIAAKYLMTMDMNCPEDLFIAIVCIGIPVASMIEFILVCIFVGKKDHKTAP